MAHLILAELTAAVISKREVDFLLKYRIEEFREEIAPFIIISVIGNEVIFADIYGNNSFPFGIDQDGFGKSTGKPVFEWFENEIEVSCKSINGKCLCSAPKPVLLLFSTVCDNCGGNI